MAWAPASARMNNLDLACQQLRRNCVQMMTKDSFNCRFRGLNHQGGGGGREVGEYVTWGGEGGPVGVWRKVTGNAISICAS